MPAPEGNSEAELLLPGLRRPPRAVETFLKRAPEDLALLQLAACEDRHDEVRRIAHKLKGSAGSLGAVQLAQLCEGLQYSSNELSGEPLRERVVSLEQAYQRVSAALQRPAPAERAAP
jgi:two-component system sensor histidine kinase/response regulator